VRRCEALRHGIKRGLGLAVLHAQTRHHAHPLRFYVDLTFRIQRRPHRLAEGIIRAAEPGSVPTGSPHCGFHQARLLGIELRGLLEKAGVLQAVQFSQLHHILGGEDEQPGNKHALGNLALLVRGRLEGLTWSV